MKINSESQVEHPRERVYTTYRDQLPDIASYIPDIKSITVQSRECTDFGVRLHNLWKADRDPPKMLKGIVKPEMLQWNDYADWHDAAFYCDWRLEIPAFSEQVCCTGRNAFFVDGPNRTRVVLTGELEIDMANFPGVPRVLAKRLSPRIESFIIKLITPNLKRVNHSIGQYLDTTT